MDWNNTNLQHAIANNCTDPDCEIHNIDIAIAEEVIDETNLAFYYAGMYAGVELAINSMDNIAGTVNDEIQQLIRSTNPIEPQSLKAEEE
jgi:hypothetical protein